jgi:hypothetical protein
MMKGITKEEEAQAVEVLKKMLGQPESRREFSLT